MKLNFCTKNIMISLAAVFLLNGCAAETIQTKRYIWPAPPAQPRIEWLKSYFDQHDFPKSGFQKTTELLFGPSPPISFDKPIDIKSNGKGLVYVADVARTAVFVYDLVNYTVSVWQKGSDTERNLGISPFYLALDRDNNLYVAGGGEQKIYVLNREGVVIRKIDFTDKVAAVAGIAVDDVKSRIYVVDSMGGKIEVFNLLGKHLFSFGKSGDGDGEFNRPVPITINHLGEIIVGDVMNARVQIFDGEGKFLRKFGERGASGGDLQIMKGLAVDSEDNIYVTDSKANQLKIYNSRGEYLMSFGKPHSVSRTMKELPGGFLLPTGIHIDSTDTMYIVDQANMRFQVFKILTEGGAAKAISAVPEKMK